MEIDYESLDTITPENLNEFCLVSLPINLKVEPVISLDDLFEVQQAIEAIAAVFGLHPDMVQIKITQPL
ncbi:hypothetical protein [Sphingomonas jaspsi]|uniref:hypothetical protein n=1 Tax=Sphingomonas jaspsi TaxID=392409 RepID=UPI0004B3E409|nr:hypothetical protein [Sphingomonas jaspsi]